MKYSMKNGQKIIIYGVIYAIRIAKNVSEHSFEERCFYDENTRIEKRTFGDEYQERFFC